MSLDISDYKVRKSLCKGDIVVYTVDNYTYEKKVLGYWPKNVELIYTVFKGYPKEDTCITDVTDIVGKLSKCVLKNTKKETLVKDIVFITKAYWYKMLGDSIVLELNK